MYVSVLPPKYMYVIFVYLILNEIFETLCDNLHLALPFHGSLGDLDKF